MAVIRRARVAVAPACAVIMVMGAWSMARLPAASSALDAPLAKRFSFVKEPLNGAAAPRTVRTVAPALAAIRQWISSVGAAVGLADLRGAGRPADVCLVDPRFDSVTIEPVPGTGHAYNPISLTPRNLPYAAPMAPMGCVPSDFNEDGRMDALVYYWGRSPVLFLRNSRPLTDGLHAFSSQELVSPFQVWNTNAVTVADVDGDGHADIVVGNYFADGARILDPRAVHQSQIHMNLSLSNAFNGGTEHVLLFHAGHGGAYPSATFAGVRYPFPAAAMRGWTLALGAQDLTGNGMPDIYIANDFGPDRLLRNVSTPGRVRFQLMRGMRHFTTPKSQTLGNDSFKGMGVAFTDINTDGIPDILVSNITEQFALEESNFAWVSTRRPVLARDGAAFYDNNSERLGLSRSGWAWDVKAGDFDDSGIPQILQATGFVQGRTNRWPELQELAMSNDAVITNTRVWPNFGPRVDLSGHDPNPFYVRRQGGRYENISAQIGVADTGVSRGIALGDVAHNGRLDFAVANQWQRSYFYRNNSLLKHPYLGLRLLRPVSPGGGSCLVSAAASAFAPAIGAEARLVTGTSGVRVGQVYPANGHGGVSAPELLFGLTANPGRVLTQVSWRDGCGHLHKVSTWLSPGWHSLSLATDGSIHEVSPP